MEARVANLNRQLEELRDEIRKRSKDMHHYTAEVESRERRLGSILEETDGLHATEESLQNELIQLRSTPGNLPREIDLIIKRYRETRQQVADSETHLSHLTRQLEELQSRGQALEGEVREAGARLAEGREEGSRLHDLLRQAESNLAQAKERQVALLEQQASLELTLRHRGSEYSRLYETLATLTKENDSIAKQVKRAELYAVAVKQAEAQLLLRVDALQVKTSEGEMAAAERQQRQKEARDEVESLRKGLSMMEGVSSGQKAQLEERQKEEEKVRAKLVSLSAKLQQLGKETVALTRQRDQDSRTCHQAKVSEQSARAVLSTKEGQLREQKKTVAQLQQQLADFAAAYKLIKTERNHAHSQIHKLQQLGNEMKEKYRILENEAEVLTMSAQEKDKLLQRCGLIHSAKTMEQDSQRQTASKLALDTAQNRAELEIQRETLGKLAHQVSSLEYQLNQMRKNYEHALQERNDVGLNLIERNEEVCVFHEKLNMQETVLRQASLQLMAREDELRYIQMEVTQLKRQILVCRKSLPEQSNLQLELDTAQKQVSACEKWLQTLESRVENAQDSTRVRLLPGPKASQEELLQQLESLETRLAHQEQAALERELLYEQVCRLADRLKLRTTAQKDSTLQVAQRVSQYQSRIKDTTRKTMALVSELTMQQANALRLRQEVSEREGSVERAYMRLEAGQPPDEATEQQWQQLLREEQLALRKVLGPAEEAQSTAEPRPNAYLPSAGELPLPKPYGSHAPFKPSPAGANMRHIRKPQPKPIDI
ncbi:Coiled-coil domain-containing protein 146 [Geodia barretti]|nr:Coiled-coil domain-containing protein 146 [Geodia barretti]